jgi:hypothetical protein
MPTINPPLDKLSVAEKLALIDQIWASLDGAEDQVESPSWHFDVLRERAKQTDFIPWEQAKAEIRRELSEG